MFYRVDYVLGVMIAGILLGLALNGWTRRIAAGRVAKTYFGVVLALLGISVASVALRLMLGHGPSWTGLFSDAGGLVYGALFGVAARRSDRQELLLHPAVLAALTISIAVAFASAGLGKAFAMAPMHAFFAQSGYSDAFLRFIVIAEVMGGLGLLIPCLMPAALAGFGIDMFGALLTHVHNGDPLNDSTGAIAMLVRLTVLALLWEWSRAAKTSPVRRPLLRVAAGWLVCLLIAGGGSLLLRHGAHGIVPAIVAIPR